MAERPLVRRREGEIRSEPVQHALEEPRDAGEHAELALKTHDRLESRVSKHPVDPQLQKRNTRLTTHTSGAMYNTSAFAGKSAMRSRAARCSAVWFAISGRYLISSFIRRSVSVWCSSGWSKALARDAYVMS